MKNRYYVQLSYKGTHYHGWQIQPNANSIQQELNNAFGLLLREPVELTGAGRTDTGVHASYYIAHFDSIHSDLHLNQKLLYKINSVLPNDIAIQKICSVKNDAHARFDATSRTYKYFIVQQKNPFFNDSAWQLLQTLDIVLMNKAAQTLKQFTDFTSFSKLHSDNKTNICQIKHAEWTVEDQKLVFNITADRFLRNMVRAIVGTLVDIGLKKINLERLKEIIESKNRSNAGTSAPAKGLFLTDIEYGYRF